MNRTRNLVIAFICTIIPFSLDAAPSVRALGGAGTVQSVVLRPSHL